MIGRVIAAWPSFALTCSYELLMRQIRQSATARAVVGARRPPAALNERLGQQPLPESPLPASPGVVPGVLDRAGGRPAARAAAGGSRVLQRRAWAWALANRRPDGSLPTGTEVARQLRRSQRWGRLVKNAGLAGRLGTGT